MSPEEIVHIIRHTLLVALQIGAPFLLLALLVGFLISLFQTAIHMQEMTLSFVPKMIAVVALLILLFPWIIKIMTKFTNDLFLHQWAKIFHDF